ncbi:MAG: hypothetical protein ACUVQV_04205 [Dissulfurimicrobium sp.]
MGFDDNGTIETTAQERAVKVFFKFHIPKIREVIKISTSGRAI